MQTYSAKLRLSGSLFNEIQKNDLTAAEVTVLRRLHGDDAVVDIKAGKQVDRTDDEERERLNGFYGKGIRRNDKIKTLDAILGVPGVPLPTRIPGVDVLPAPKTGRRTTPVAEPIEPAEPIQQTEFA